MDAEGFRKSLIEKIKQDFILQDANKFEKRAPLTQTEAQQKFKKLVDIINLADKKLDIRRNQKVQQELDKKIRRTIMMYPELLTVQDEHKQNIGIICAKFGLEQSVLVALQDNEASLQQDESGMNIGMWCAIGQLFNAVVNALDNNEASLQQDCWGRNIGMFCAMLKLETATLKALNNYQASLQQDETGFNIGIYAAQSGLENATLKALDNNEASLQQDEDYRNIGIHCALSSLTKSVIKSMQNKKACEQVSKYGETIQSLYKQHSQELSK